MIAEPFLRKFAEAYPIIGYNFQYVEVQLVYLIRVGIR